jgi:WhiB family redox-sensing transcriptional regulator
MTDTATFAARTQSWIQEAECRGLPPDLFFEAKHEEEALSYCAVCPVRKLCLADALIEEASAPNGRYGIRGGKTAKERARLHRQQTRVVSGRNRY